MEKTVDSPERSDVDEGSDDDEFDQELPTELCREDFVNDEAWFRFLREVKGITTFADVIKHLEEKHMLSEPAKCDVSTASDYDSKDTVNDLMYKKDVPLPPILQHLACVLHFRSSELYNYVKSNFLPALPDAKTVRGYMMTTMDEPGISSEAISSISKLCREAEARKEKLYFSLICDEMQLEHNADFDGEQMQGQMDIGTGTEQRMDIDEAHGALVFLLVGVNINLTITAAYYLIDHIDSEEKKNVLTDLLHVTHEHSIPICSVVIDHEYSTGRMVKELAAVPRGEDQVPTSFPHPVTSESVAVVRDHAHYVRMLKMGLELSKRFTDLDGKTRRWKNSELRRVLREIFDFFYSRVPLVEGTEQRAITADNLETVKTRVERYIQNFELFRSRNSAVLEELKAFAILSHLRGLFACLRSVMLLAERLLTEGNVTELFVNRLCHDHIKLLFKKVERACRRDIPWGYQFKPAFKKIQKDIRAEMRLNRQLQAGDCLASEKF